ncbi:MAG: biopolymer transporter ExbD [Bacteroidetes bacterium GWF2_40_14]|nr:MAG: biopolymer transporter ExbD [Bacteroidetes bacterium GWF2_40_14]
MARPAQQLPSSSLADIAFMVLIFFLLVSTMDQDLGLQRRLPPMPDPNQKADDVQIKRRNMMIVRLNENDRLLAGGSQIDVSMLKDKAMEFLLNNGNDENLPEREVKTIEGFGSYPVSKGVISLQNHRGTSYDAYLKVQNELVKAVNIIRDEFAMTNFGKIYINLDEEKQRIVRDAIPQNISEAEPKDTGRKK